MEAARQAGFLSVKARPKVSPKPARRLIGFWQTAIRSGLRNEPGFALPRLRRGCCKPRFRNLFSAGAENRFLPPSAPRKQRLFRSWFDSSQARQTVRWRRFWGLEFALFFVVKRGLVCGRCSAEVAARRPGFAVCCLVCCPFWGRAVRGPGPRRPGRRPGRRAGGLQKPAARR